MGVCRQPASVYVVSWDLPMWWGMTALRCRRPCICSSRATRCRWLERTKCTTACRVGCYGAGHSGKDNSDESGGIESVLIEDGHYGENTLGSFHPGMGIAVVDDLLKAAGTSASRP